MLFWNNFFFFDRSQKQMTYSWSVCETTSETMSKHIHNLTGKFQHCQICHVHGHIWWPLEVKVTAQCAILGMGSPKHGQGFPLHPGERQCSFILFWTVGGNHVPDFGNSITPHSVKKNSKFFSFRHSIPSLRTLQKKITKKTLPGNFDPHQKSNIPMLNQWENSLESRGLKIAYKSV